MNTQEKVISIIADKLGSKEHEISVTSHIQKDLGADSLDFVEILMEVEKQFQISIPDEDAEKIETVQDAINYVDRVTQVNP